MSEHTVFDDESDRALKRARAHGLGTIGMLCCHFLFFLFPCYHCSFHTPKVREVATETQSALEKSIGESAAFCVLKEKSRE